MTDPVRILLHNNITLPLEDALKSAVPDAEIATCTTMQDLPDALRKHRPEVVYTVRFDSSVPYPRDALFGPDGPRWVANGGVGTDHFGTWDPSRITVTNAAGVAADMIAEYVLGCFLHFTLDVPGLQQDKANRLWQNRSVTPLKGKRLLIIGLGHTGRAVAARARAFGMHVTGTRANPVPMEDVDDVRGAADLADLLPHADCTVVCTPLTRHTRGMMGAPQIGALKQGAIFVDVSRGGVSDTDALRDALMSGALSGAALDVFETEPLPDISPLWETPNLIISPHCSAVHDGWEKDSFELFLRNLKNHISGQPLFNVVDPLRGY